MGTAPWNNLAELYQMQGRYAEAESLYKRSLTRYAKDRGPEDPEVGRIANDLALLYQAQGRYTEAEALLAESRVICEKTRGPK